MSGLAPGALRLPPAGCRSPGVPRQFNGNSGSAARTFALGARIATMSASDSAHNEQSQAAALHLRRARREHAIKAFEHTLQLAARYADAVVAHANLHVLQVRSLNGD